MPIYTDILTSNNFQQWLNRTNDISAHLTATTGGANTYHADTLQSATTIVAGTTITADGDISTNGDLVSAGVSANTVTIAISSSLGSTTATDFTSNGIDDNASTTQLTISDTLLTLGQDAAFSIANPQVDGGDTDGSLTIYANTTSLGGTLRLFGDTHSTQASDIEFRSNATLTLHYDFDSTTWDFRTNTITTSGALVAGSLTTGGAASVGTFTSTGIDDNATAERLQIADTVINYGGDSTGTYSILRGDTGSTTGMVSFSSTNSSIVGSNIQMYSNLHSSQANDFLVRSGGTSQAHYDDSASTWDFQANTITTTGTITSPTIIAGSTTVGSNAEGTRHVSASAPTGGDGADGDIWYQTV